MQQTEKFFKQNKLSCYYVSLQYFIFNLPVNNSLKIQERELAAEYITPYIEMALN